MFITGDHDDIAESMFWSKHLLVHWEDLCEPSVLSLIFSNVVVIIWALWEGWSLAVVMWVYWIQSIIIGFFWFLRILALEKSYSGEALNEQGDHRRERAFFFTTASFTTHMRLSSSLSRLPGRKRRICR